MITTFDILDKNVVYILLVLFNSGDVLLSVPLLNAPFSCLLPAPSRPGRLPLIRPMSPDQVLRELPPARPVAPSTDLFVDCSEIPGNVSPAEAPVILSQPRTGTADYYELIWEPRHDGGAPVLEYVVKYRKVKEFYSTFI